MLDPDNRLVEQAREWVRPAAMDRIPLRVVIRTRTELFCVDPFPNWPRPLPPQAQTDPSAVRAREWSPLAVSQSISS